METRANYVLIGAFTILASVALLVFALWAAKFSSDRNWRDIKNIVKGYTGGIRPKAGEEVRFCLINQSASERTNAPGVVWK